MFQSTMNEMNCPWMNHPRGNFPLCEEALCEWIRQPANTYSNLAFFMVSFFLIYLFIKNRSSYGLGFGLCTLIIGTASSLAHAAGTKFFGFFDFVAIFSAFSLYAAHNTIYSFAWPQRNVFFVMPLFFIPAAVLLYQFIFLREIIFGAFVVGLMISESKILREKGQPFLTASMQKLLMTFGLGAVCLGLDASKVICYPDNHLFQMHSIWHICCALSLYFLCRHLDQHRPRV